MPKEYLEAQETSVIEDKALCFRDQVLIRLLRRLGCRVGEVLGLGEDDFDFKNGLVRIEHEKMRVTISCPHCHARLSKGAAFCLKCGSSVTRVVNKEKEEHHLRKIPIDKASSELVQRYLRETKLPVFNGKKILFPMSRQWAWHIVKDCAERAGFKELINPETDRVHHVSPHKFRDAFAIQAIKADDSMDGVRLLQGHLGHQSYDTTMKYRKVSSKEQKDWFDKVTGE